MTTDITNVKEVKESLVLTEVNQKLEDGWILLAVLQNTEETVSNTYAIVYVIGRV